MLLALDDDKTRAAPVVKALVFACIAKADDMVVVVVVSSSSSSSFVEQSKNDADVYIHKRGGGSQLVARRQRIERTRGVELCLDTLLLPHKKKATKRG